MKGQQDGTSGASAAYYSIDQRSKETLELLDGICANNGTKRIYPEVDHDESNALVFI